MRFLLDFLLVRRRYRLMRCLLLKSHQAPRALLQLLLQVVCNVLERHGFNLLKRLLLPGRVVDFLAMAYRHLVWMNVFTSRPLSLAHHVCQVIELLRDRDLDSTSVIDDLHQVELLLPLSTVQLVLRVVVHVLVAAEADSC